MAGGIRTAGANRAKADGGGILTVKKVHTQGGFRRSLARGGIGELKVRLLTTAVLFALFAAHATGLVTFGAISHLDNLAYDSRLRLSMPFTVDEDIVIVGVDEPSLAQNGRWPWRRDQVAELVDTLFERYRVRALGLDVVFAEPQDGQRVSSAENRAHSQWRSLGGWLESTQSLRRERTADERLADELRGRNVTSAVLFRGGDDAGSVGVLPQSLMRWESLPKGLEPLEAESFTGNIPVVAEAISSGFADNPLLDPDGHYRRVPLLRAHGGQIYPSLALRLAWMVSGRDDDKPLLAKDSRFPLVSGFSLDAGPGRVPIDRQAAIHVPFRGPRFSFPYVSAADVFNGNASADVLEGRVVLIGAWASRLAQVHATPVASAMPNVEIQANILSGLLDGRVMQAPGYVTAIEVAALFLTGLLMTVAFLAFGGWGATASTLGVLGLFAAGNLFAWQGLGLILPFACVAMFILVLFVCQLLYSQVVEARSRAQLSTVFGQYVPRELVDEIAARPQSVSLAGESRHMTVLFSDIHGFSGIAEALNPRQLSHLMNEFLTVMTRVIHHHRGTIDKYMGDSVMAFWGAPLDAPDHARRAVNAALDMQVEMERLNERFAERGWPRLRLGIGLNTGHMSVGNMGSEFRMAYTVMGDAVNLASRLEGLTRQYGIGIIVSEFTRAAVPEVRFMELGRANVRGREGPVTLYEPLGVPDELDERTERRAMQYERALDAARAGRDWEAEMIAGNLLVEDPGRYRLYRRLLDDLDRRPEADDRRPGEKQGQAGL